MTRSALTALLLCLGMVQLHAAEPTSVWIVVLRVGAYGYSGTIVPDNPSNFKAYATEAAWFGPRASRSPQHVYSISGNA